MNYVVYVLRNDFGMYYIGHTNDLSRRLTEHNDKGRFGWAARRGPWNVVYRKIYETRNDAVKEERRLKSLKNKDKLHKHISG